MKEGDRRPAPPEPSHAAGSEVSPTAGFAEVLREEMGVRNISYRRLAAELKRVDARDRGLSAGHLANLVAGRQRPSLRAIELIERALGVTLADLPETRAARSHAALRRRGDGQACEGCGIDPTVGYAGAAPDDFLQVVATDGPRTTLALCRNCLWARDRDVALPADRAPARDARRDDDAFRERVVSLYLNSQRSLRAVAAEFDLPVGVVSRWVRDARSPYLEFTPYRAPRDRRRDGGAAR